VAITEPYIPAPVPNQVAPEVRQYLDQEFERVALLLNQSLRAPAFVYELLVEVADTATGEFNGNQSPEGIWFVVCDFSTDADAILTVNGTSAAAIHTGVSATVNSGGTSANTPNRANYYTDANGHLLVHNRLGGAAQFRAYKMGL